MSVTLDRTLRSTGPISREESDANKTVSNSDRSQKGQTPGCFHCGDACFNPVRYQEKNFCCTGCKAVYQILSTNDLTEFYVRRESSELSKFSRKKIFRAKGNEGPEKTRLQNLFSQIEEIEVQKPQSQRTQSSGEAPPLSEYRIQVFVHGMHCPACYWLFEKLKEKVPKLLAFDLNHSKNLLTISSHSRAEVEKTIALVENLGHQLEASSDFGKIQNKEDKLDLLRIGLVGFLSGNIMMYTLGVYTGADFLWEGRLNFLSALLFLPVWTYGAMPFYRSAWRGLIHRSLSIDTTISIALISAGALSYVQFIRGMNEVYFDTLAIFVFLLLSSRFFIKKVQRTIVEKIGQTQRKLFLTPVTRVGSGHKQGQATPKNKPSTEKVAPSELLIGDLVTFQAGERILITGRLLQGGVRVDSSVLTGETIPQERQQGDLVFAGELNLVSEAQVEVTEKFENSQYGNILSTISEYGDRAPYLNFLNQISKALLVLALGASIFCLLTMGSAGVSRALAILVVTCPCALGLVAPLFLNFSLKAGLSKGLAIKSGSILEKIPLVEKVFFDKTGTATTGVFEVKDFKNLSDYSDEYVKSLAYSLETASTHPIGRGLVKYLAADKSVLNINFEQGSLKVSRTGVCGELNGHRYSISGEFFGESSGESFENKKTECSEFKSSKSLVVSLKEDDQIIADFKLEDYLKTDFPKTLKLIESQPIKILSGDNADRVSEFQGHIESALKGQQIASIDYYSGLTPDIKKSMVNEENPVLFVGDGINDLPAMDQASVSMALNDALGVTLNKADVVSLNRSPLQVAELIHHATVTMKWVKSAAIFSLLYNFLFIGLAVFGQISPLMAAILMPISSLSILLLSLIAFKNLKKRQVSHD